MISISSVGRFWNTVKYLTIRQIFYRLRYKFLPVGILRASISDFSICEWVWCAPEALKVCLYIDGRACFLGRRASLSDRSIWNSPDFDKLWLYNLHYFDDMNAVGSASRRDVQLILVKRWIRENPRADAGIGWEPYTLSLRLVNWVKWYKRSNINDAEIIESIYVQADSLTKQLEYHILGNHLFSNAKALIFVGAFLEGEEATRFIQLGLDILSRELVEQFLLDGGHFELSPMYHSILLWDLLDLINLARLSQHPLLRTYEKTLVYQVTKALYWLEAMTHPDRDIVFFNDCALAIAAKPKFIFEYARRLCIRQEKPIPVPLETFPQSGYSRLTMPRHVAFFDHANIGPDYLPGHAHADSLSIEWSVGAQRVIVNSGTSLYGLSRERLRQRKTAAHSTVEVDGEDSSEVWGGFRVAKRAYSSLEYARVHPAGNVEIKASHNGYLRLKGKVIHKRELKACARSLCLTDDLSGSFHEAKAFFHFHPDVCINQTDTYSIDLTLPSGELIAMRSTGKIEIKPSSWHPEFGQSITSKMCVVTFVDSTIQTNFTLV